MALSVIGGGGSEVPVTTCVVASVTISCVTASDVTRVSTEDPSAVGGYVPYVIRPSSVVSHSPSSDVVRVVGDIVVGVAGLGVVDAEENIITENKNRTLCSGGCLGGCLWATA